MDGTDLRRILSRNIKALRSQRSLTQEELAEKAGISVPFLSNIERSNKWPHPDSLTRLAEALNVEVYTLFQDSKPPLPEEIMKTLEQYKKDMAISLHKTVSAAIDCSLETIGSHYIPDSSNVL